MFGRDYIGNGGILSARKTLLASCDTRHRVSPIVIELVGSRGSMG